LASFSSASSSIHSTTERQTSPTTLPRWAGGGGSPGLGPADEGLGAVGRDAGRGGAAELHPHRAGRGGQDDAFVGVFPQFGVAPPAGDGLFKIAHHRETKGRHAGRHMIDQAEGALREVAQALVDGHPQRAALEGPVTAGELGHAVGHRPSRAQAQRGQHHVAEEDAEDMAVCGQQRVLDDVAQQLGARQLAGVQVAPLGQQPTGLVFVTALQRLADVGEVVAELTEAQRQVDHADVEHQRQQQAVVGDRGMDAPGQQRRHDDRDGPHHAGMLRSARIEVAACPAHPRNQ